MSKKMFVLVNNDIRRRASQYALHEAADGDVVKFAPAARTLDQNAAQWPLLEAFSLQALWPVNGEMVKMEPDEWKQVLSAGFRQETARLAMGLNGGVVMLGARTSKMSKGEFSEWLEFLHAVAAQRGVKLSA